MKALTASTLERRQVYLFSYEKVIIDGVRDEVAVGYVRVYDTGRAAYLVFLGRQTKPAHHYSTSSAEAARTTVEQLLMKAAQHAEQKAAARRAPLTPRLPYTERESGGVIRRQYSTAGTAQLIREALKKAFPTVKFSVTSQTCAGGSSVHVQYTDGPTVQAIQQVYAAYESGHFDGSQDMYVHKRADTVVNLSGQLVQVSYGAQYIQEHRTYSSRYGHFLNALDLCHEPPLEAQFEAFYDWHRRHVFGHDAQLSHKGATFTITTNRPSADLERFAEALAIQGHEVELSDAGDTLSARPGAAAGVNRGAALDPIDEEYRTAEMAWLQAA